MDSWLSKIRDELADIAGLAGSELELTDDASATLLDLAALAAHESGDRTNAPLLCYLVGKAERTADLDTLAAAVRGDR